MNTDFTRQSPDFTGPSPQRTTGTDSRLDWLLDDLIARAAHVQKAVILSRDGLTTGTSATLRREDSDHLSALAAGLQSLASGGALHFGAGHVHQTVIEMDRGYLFVTAAGEGSCLAVLADSQADVGLVAYEMALMVKQLGRHMAVGSRPVPGADEVM
jgi:predicted regulator of Ras-like GTPase activity (Roadblock/LC7/MglB family)